MAGRAVSRHLSRLDTVRPAMTTLGERGDDLPRRTTPNGPAPRPHPKDQPTHPYIPTPHPDYATRLDHANPIPNSTPTVINIPTPGGSHPHTPTATLKTSKTHIAPRSGSPRGRSADPSRVHSPLASATPFPITPPHEYPEPIRAPLNFAPARPPPRARRSRPHPDPRAAPRNRPKHPAHTRRIHRAQRGTNAERRMTYATSTVFPVIARVPRVAPTGRCRFFDSYENAMGRCSE